MAKDQNDPLPESTADRLASEFKVSAPTIKRDGQYAAAVDALASVGVDPQAVIAHASYLRGKRYNGEKQDKGGDRKSIDQNDPLIESTADRLASEYKVSAPTIKRENSQEEIAKELHVSQPTVSKWLSRTLKEEKELKKKAAFKLWLACHTHDYQRSGVTNIEKKVVENLPPPSDSGKSRDKAAETVGVSGKSVDAAVKVIKQGSPELIQAVEQGKVAVSTAATIAQLPKSEQAKLVKAGDKKELRRK